MGILEALILGILQGLTEFLPVSSSGHLELGKVIMSVPQSDITFTVVVHGATVLSTVIVFWKDIVRLVGGLFSFSWNDETKYIAKIAVSMIPAVLAGLFFEEQIDGLFVGNLFLVGGMLLFTGLLLAFTFFAKPKEGELGFGNAAIIGLAQAVAIIPGVSRSGSTIATGLLLGSKKDGIAQFSFLMVIPLIVGANLKKLLENDADSIVQTDALPLIVGFVAAFVTGLIACKAMLKIVKNGKLIWFAYYCFAVGAIALGVSFI